MLTMKKANVEMFRKCVSVIDLCVFALNLNKYYAQCTKFDEPRYSTHKNNKNVFYHCNSTYFQTDYDNRKVSSPGTELIQWV